jgi:hypothetical protein
MQGKGRSLASPSLRGAHSVCQCLCHPEAALWPRDLLASCPWVGQYRSEMPRCASSGWALSEQVAQPLDVLHLPSG